MTVAGKDTFYKEAVEFELHVSEPFQIRALGPVLWVGDEPLTIADQVTTAFIASTHSLRTSFARMHPIALAWNSAGAERKSTSTSTRRRNE